MTATIEEVITNLTKVSIKIVLVVNDSCELQGTISDGDIRRGLLRGLNLNSSIESIIHHNPLVVTDEIGREDVRKLMVANKIQQVPVVDDRHHIVGLYLWDEISTPLIPPNMMFIMDG